MITVFWLDQNGGTDNLSFVLGVYADRPKAEEAVKLYVEANDVFELDEFQYVECELNVTRDV